MRRPAEPERKSQETLLLLEKGVDRWLTRCLRALPFLPSIYDLPIDSYRSFCLSTLHL